MTELRGTETGLWQVATLDSIHMFDLDAGTTERLPGPDARTCSVDRPRQLRSIETCRVGERGFWTIRSHESLIDYYWHESSIVQSINLIEQKKFPPSS